MSSRAYKRGRCALCGKPKEHEIHRVERGPGLLRRLLHLAWPRWVWSGAGRHQPVDRDKVVDASDEMAANERWFKRVRRTR